MAQMFPEFYDTNTPPGEKIFFDWLAQECPIEWRVFHGLDLQAWNGSKQTEIDFVVVMPNTGILCIEIKSHQKVEVRSGTWYLHNKPQGKSPLKQAEDAQKTFYRRIKDKLPSLARVPSTRLVCFPRVLVDFPESMEHNSWELWNMDDCQTAVSSKQLPDKLRNVLESSIRHTSYLHKLQHPVSAADCEKLKQFLRPAFKSAPASVAESKARQQRLDSYLRKQQKPVLRLFRDNERILLDGPAGTGKSIIALEIARRAADEGLRVGILCFNRPMAHKLKTETQDDAPLLIGGGIHSCLANMLDIEIPENAGTEFWDFGFLDAAEERLLDEERTFECQFDVLVIDEVQDLLARPRLLDVVECLLRGGFHDGKWLLAGDFNYQIFANDELRALAVEKLDLLREIPRVQYYRLDENCRNYRMVGQPALNLAGMPSEDVYSDFMRGDGEHSFFNPKYYSKDNQQLDLLISEIKSYVNAGTALNDITVLSFRTADKSVAAELVESDIPTRRIGQDRNGVGYGSIYEFKGLESRVVILTDVKQPTSQLEKDLFYVGMTRALFSVSILVPQSDQSWFVSAVHGDNDE
jgi:hypothetical protein